MHRFFVHADLLCSPDVQLPTEVAHQVTRVLRLRAGARVALFCGDGDEHEALIEAVGPQSVVARVVERRTPEVELRCALQVAVAVLKGEKLDWVVQKLTELGASRISLLLTERTVVAAGEERWPHRMERYRRISREAAEQSGRVRVPEVDEPCPLAQLLEEHTHAVSLFLDPYSDRSMMAHVTPCPEQVTVFIGPEGGFTGEEAQHAREAGAIPARLGPRILRAETAALAAATVVATAAEG